MREEKRGGNFIGYKMEHPSDQIPLTNARIREKKISNIVLLAAPPRLRKRARGNPGPFGRLGNSGLALKIRRQQCLRRRRRRRRLRRLRRLRRRRLRRHNARSITPG